jgi:hypothetical protein
MNGKRVVITALLLSLVIAVSHTQELEETRRLMVFFEVLPEAELTQREGILLYEALLLDLSDASRRIAVKEYGDQYLPPSDEEKNIAAEEQGADSWLYVAISGSTDLLQIEARALDLLSGRIILEQTIEREMLRGIRDLQLQFWKEVSNPLAQYFASAISRDMNSGTLVFEGVPGTRIHGSAWKRMKIDDQGKVSIPVPLPATLPYRASKPGLFPIEGQIYMDQATKTIHLDQQKAARLAIDAYLHNMSYPGVGLTYFFVPDAVFGRIGLISYLIGISLNDSQDGSGSIFVSNTLNNLSMAFGFFFNDPDRYFRSYFALGATWRFITAQGYWGIEPIAPFAAQPILGIEYARGRKLKVFAEYAPYFYWAPERYLFALSLPLDHDPKFLFIPTAKDAADWAVVWEIFVFNVGVRIRL